MKSGSNEQWPCSKDACSAPMFATTGRTTVKPIAVSRPEYLRLELPGKAGYAIFYLALGVVLVAPFALGSFRPRFWFGVESAVFLLFSLFCLTGMVGRQWNLFRDYKAVFVLSLCWTAWPLIQLIPLPAGLVGIVSSTTYETTRLSSPESSFLTLSMQNFATVDEFLKRLMYVCIFTMMLFLSKKPGQLTAVVWSLAAFGLLHGINVLFAYTEDPQSVIRSTYTNRNHFAMYIAVCLAATIGLFLAIYNESGRRGLEGLVNGELIIPFVTMVVLVTVLMFSLSKGAFVAFVAGTMLTWLLLRQRRGRNDAGRGGFVIWLIAASVAGSMFVAGVSSLFSRFAVEKIFGDERWLQWADSMKLAMDYWVAGSGAGTYKFVFPAYKTFEYRPLVYHHVHNDYLEAFCNEGIAGLILMVGVFLAWLIAMQRRYRSRRDPKIRGIAFGIHLAATTVMVHAFFDFNLQVPANALTLFALMGVGLAALSIKRPTSDARKP